MKFLLIAICLTNFISCDREDDYVYFDQPPVQETFSRTFNILSLVQDKKIDILWVVDNSGSMHDIQQNIVTNTALFMQAFQKNKHIEWKMGLVSTDKGEDPYLGFDRLAPFDHTSINPVSTFQTNVNRLGTNGDAWEYVFYNVDRMISPILQTATDRTHFFRADAHLVVIMVTDEEEQSDGINRTLYQAQSFYNHLRGLKSADKVIRFYGAFGLGDMQGCSSSDDYLASSFEEIINLTGGFAISACDSTFGNRLADVGSDIVSILKSPSIPINARPKTETLEVFFKGKKLPGGPKSLGGIWYYNRAHSTIDFYDLDFAGGNLKVADVEVRFDIDDGVDRREE